MADENKDEPIVDVEQTFSKTEQYIEKNQKSLMIIVGAIIAVVAIYFGWKKFYYEDQVAEAASNMFYAEQQFQNDSLNLAVNGDGKDKKGFIQIAEEYSMTPSGNLAHYYLGVCYLKKGEFEKSISEFKDYDGSDMMIAPMAIGDMGDAYMELGKTEDAISAYVKAAEKSKNNFTSPYFLKKAGQAYEEMSKYDDAVKAYEKIKAEYGTTQEGKDIDKYIARAKGLAGV